MSKIFVNTIFPNSGGHVSVSGSLLLSGSGDGPSLEIFGDISASGNITAKQYHIQEITSSVLFEDGPTKFGNDSSDTHQFTGRISVTGSDAGHITASGNISASGDIINTGNVTSDGSGSFSYIKASGNISASGNIFAKEVIINRQDAGEPGLQVYHASENLLVQLESGDSEAMIDFKDNATTDNVLMGARGNDFLMRSDAGVIEFNVNNNGTTGLSIGHNGSITASGIITASQLRADGFGNGGIYVNGHVIVTEQIIGNQFTQTFGNHSFANLYTGKRHIFTGSGDHPGHITASGTISSSGNLIANKLILDDGDSSNPSLTFGSDTDTGIFRSAADILAFQVGGGNTEMALNDSSNRLAISTAHLSVGSTSFERHITASGNISASGNIIGATGSFTAVSASGGITANLITIPAYRPNLGDGDFGEIRLSESGSDANSRVFVRNQINPDSAAEMDYGLSLGDTTYGITVNSPVTFAGKITASAATSFHFFDGKFESTNLATMSIANESATSTHTTLELKSHTSGVDRFFRIVSDGNHTQFKPSSAKAQTVRFLSPLKNEIVFAYGGSGGQENKIGIGALPAANGAQVHIQVTENTGSGAINTISIDGVNSTGIAHISASGNISASSGTLDGGLISAHNFVEGTQTVAAAGSDQSGATAINAENGIVFASTDDAAKGIKLPTVASVRIGQSYVIYNTSATTIKVYPGSGDRVFPLADDANATLPVNASMTVTAFSADGWQGFFGTVIA